MGSEWPGLVQGCSQVLGEQLSWIIQAFRQQNETLKPTRDEQIQITLCPPRHKLLSLKEVEPQLKALSTCRMENLAWLWPLRTGFAHRSPTTLFLVFPKDIHISTCVLCFFTVLCRYFALFITMTWSINKLRYRCESCPVCCKQSPTFTKV